MGLLKSVENVPGIDYYEYRDVDYYNKYTYRARFHIFGARYIYGYKSLEEFRKYFEKRMNFLINDRYKKDVKKNMPILEKFLEWNLSSKKTNKYSVRVEGPIIGVYSNDLNFLHDIKNHIPNIHVDYTEVQKSVYVGVKQFVKEPKHKYRVYLKSKRVDNDLVKHLLDSIVKNKQLYPSSALKFWLNNAIDKTAHWRYRWSSASHFIDYDDESTLSYLALMYGEMLGKRYKLEKRPD